MTLSQRAQTALRCKASQSSGTVRVPQVLKFAHVLKYSDRLFRSWHVLSFRQRRARRSCHLAGARAYVRAHLELHPKCTFPHVRRRGRAAEGGGLLNRYRVVMPYRGFESLRLRQLRTELRTPGVAGATPAPAARVLSKSPCDPMMRTSLSATSTRWASARRWSRR